MLRIEHLNRLSPKSNDLLIKIHAASVTRADTMMRQGLPFFGKLKQNQQVLIIGASGSLGSAAVQIGKQIGARVSAVCSGANGGWVKSLGADRVIDYKKEDFTQQDTRYDIIFDTTGKHAFSRCKPVLTANAAISRRC